MQPQAELLVDARHGTGESPVWHVGEQALYWVDIPARALWRWDSASGQLSSWLAPEMLACIAWGGFRCAAPALNVGHCLSYFA